MIEDGSDMTAMANLPMSTNPGGCDIEGQFYMDGMKVRCSILSYMDGMEGCSFLCAFLFYLDTMMEYSYGLSILFLLN
jgi:hypothetical protein